MIDLICQVMELASVKAYAKQVNSDIAVTLPKMPPGKAQTKSVASLRSSCNEKLREKVTRGNCRLVHPGTNPNGVGERDLFGGLRQIVRRL